MTVTLSKLTEEIVQMQLRTGRYASADEVVNRLIEEQLSAVEEFPSGPSAGELEASLLSAVTKATQPFKKGDFVELARRVIADDRGA